MPTIAELLNEHFVCIKVDREERPDIDDIYMKAVQLLNQGQGGWPMSVWLTPDLQPFYAGTYFPPDDRYGRPGFPRVLVALATAWRDRRDELTEVGRRDHRTSAELRRVARRAKSPSLPNRCMRHAGKAAVPRLRSDPRRLRRGSEVSACAGTATCCCDVAAIRR